MTARPSDAPDLFRPSGVPTMDLVRHRTEMRTHDHPALAVDYLARVVGISNGDTITVL